MAMQNTLRALSAPLGMNETGFNPQGSLKVRAAQDEWTREICETAGAFGGLRLKQARILFGRSSVVQGPPEGAADGVSGCPCAQWQRPLGGEVKTDSPERKIQQNGLLASSPTYTYN